MLILVDIGAAVFVVRCIIDSFRAHISALDASIGFFEHSCTWVLEGADAVYSSMVGGRS
jgi:hypothetical protein